MEGGDSMSVLKYNRINKLGITQQEIADRLGVSLYTVKSWEQGVKHIKVVDLAEVSRAYKLSIVDLLNYIKESSTKGNIEYKL